MRIPISLISDLNIVHKSNQIGKSDTFTNPSVIFKNKFQTENIEDLLGSSSSEDEQSDKKGEKKNI